MNLQAQTRDEAVSELVSLFCRTEGRPDEQKIIEAVSERERRASTGIGWGVAVPHARIAQLDRIVVCIGYSCRGIDFSSPDGSLSRVVILILSPETDFSGHLRFLADLSGCLSLVRWRRRLLGASTPEEVVAVFQGGYYGNN